MPWPYAILDALCVDVGILRSESLPQMPTIPAEPPTDAAFWNSSYAQLLFWPTDEDALLDAAIDGEAWLDESLFAAENPNSPVDGYLVIALPHPPAHEATLSFVRRVELSTRVCRKQVVWPSESSVAGWRGLAAVSVLGFPDVGAGEQANTVPALDPDAAALWERIEEFGHVRAAEQDREEGA